MLDHSATDDIQFDVFQAFKEVAPCVDHGGVVSILPESTAALLEPVIGLAELTIGFLYKPANLILVFSESQEVRVIASDRVIQQ